MWDSFSVWCEDSDDLTSSLFCSILCLFALVYRLFAHIRIQFRMNIGMALSTRYVFLHLRFGFGGRVGPLWFPHIRIHESFGAVSQTPKLSRLHKDASRRQNPSIWSSNFVTMEDRSFEPMLVASNSHVNSWERMYGHVAC